MGWMMRARITRTAGTAFTIRTSTGWKDGVGWKGRKNRRGKNTDVYTNATGPTDPRHQIPSREGVSLNGGMVERMGCLPGKIDVHINPFRETELKPALAMQVLTFFQDGKYRMGI